MDVTTVSLALSALALVISVYTMSQKSEQPAAVNTENFTTRPLQLQAYERLALLCERMAIPNLISRVNQPGLTAREMQILLIETIKQEYEYNASQQIYVTQEAWNAVRTLRDQTLLVVNSFAKSLPPDATASDLSRKIIEEMLQDERAALHSFVTATLNAEAKKIM